MSPMLKRIFADNFRALVNFEFRPGSLSLLLGGNGSGKTSVFDVLGKLRDLIVLGLRAGELFTATRTVWETREVQRFEIDLDGNDGTFRYALEIQYSKGITGVPFIRSENVTFDGVPLYRFSAGEVQLYHDDGTPGSLFPFRPDQSFLLNVDTPGAKRMARLAGFKELVAGLRIVQPNPFAFEFFSRQDQDFLARNGGNFASFFSHLNNERPEARTDNLLELSEGQRVLAVLYASVCDLVRNGAVLCFDEPDNFVALSEIQPWLQVLRDALETRGGQAMIISHHPEVMDYLALDSLWWFERPSGPVIVRPFETDTASPLKLSELVARGAA
jgi:putative AbiEii toxin of type IV toxin-antitoxin system